MADAIDAVDLGHMEEVVRSDGYALIIQHLRRVQEAKLRELRNRELTQEQTQHLRGLLDGIDRALSAPDQIRAEWERQKVQR